MTSPPKTALITGGGRGIGRASALAFARAGFDVAVVARSADQLDQTRRLVEPLGRKCLAITADLTHPDSSRDIVRRVESAFRRVDVLLNNAGTGRIASIHDFSLDEFDRTFALNVRAVYAMCQAVWPLMQRDGGGTIINVSSVAAKDPFPGFTVYAATKAAVNLLSTGLAAEGKPHGIRVFALAPGAVETGLLRSVAPDFPADQCLRPEDVAEMAVSLSDPRTPHSPGQSIYLQK